MTSAREAIRYLPFEGKCAVLEEENESSAPFPDITVPILVKKRSELRLYVPRSQWRFSCTTSIEEVQRTTKSHVETGDEHELTVEDVCEYPSWNRNA